MNYNLQEIESNQINFNQDDFLEKIIDIEKIKSQIKSNSPSEGVYSFSNQINFIKFFDQNDLNDEENPYLDFIVFPSKSSSPNHYDNIFEIRVNHLKQDEFYECLGEYCEEIGDSVYINSFYDYLLNSGVSVQILQ